MKFFTIMYHPVFYGSIRYACKENNVMNRVTIYYKLQIKKECTALCGSSLFRYTLTVSYYLVYKLWH